MAEFPKLAADGHNWTTWREPQTGQVHQRSNAKLVRHTSAWTREAHDRYNYPPILTRPYSHLKSAHDGFKTLSNLFEKPAPMPTTTYNIRTVADTRQKPSEGSCKVRDRETAANKAESAVVEEPHDVRCRKHKCDAGSHGRVETRGREGKRAAGWMSEQGAAARGPGEGVTDLKASVIGPAIMPSSQEDDTGVRCTPVMPQEPQAHRASRRITQPPGRATRDNGPAGSDDARGEGREVSNRVDKGERRASEKVAAARGPGEDATDRTADGTSTDETTNETTAPPCMPLEGERGSQATSGSMRAHSEGAKPPDGTADAQDGTQTQRCAKGTRTGQQHDASAHGEGRCARAEWPSSMHERNSCTMSGSTRVPEGIIEDLGGRAESNTSDRPPSAPLEGEQGRQLTSGSARVPHRIVEDPGGRIKPSRQADRPPSTPLEGERGHQPLSGYTDDRTIAHEHRDNSECNGSALAANAPRGLFEGEQGGWKSTSHTHEEAPHSDATKTGGERNAPGGHRMGRINHDVNKATRHHMIQAAAYSGETRDRSDGDGSRRDGATSSNNGAMSDTSRDSKRVKTGPLAEDEARQDRWYMHRLRDDIPEPCTPPATHPKRPTEPVNPPCRRGRLKTRPARIHRARAYKETRAKYPRKIQPHRVDASHSADALEMSNCNL
ncbi:hypothetical protein BU15DRAFT_70819 [Melanogaster broomeanus]|nr:hypothetical protein BU15DRAFT_70819 [Melanogaster broomeanus]